MSVFRSLFDNDWFQRKDINRLEEETSSAAGRLDSARDRTMRLEDRVTALEDNLAQLVLFNKTLLRMIVEKQVCAPEEFTNLFKMLDREDGTEDGKVTSAPEAGGKLLCRNCRRPLPKNKRWCMYCGHREPE